MSGCDWTTSFTFLSLECDIGTTAQNPAYSEDLGMILEGLQLGIFMAVQYNCGFNPPEVGRWGPWGPCNL
jgi:hypothetical protein